MALTERVRTGVSPQRSRASPSGRARSPGATPATTTCRTHHRDAMSRPIDFTLPDHAGGSFRLSDALRERTVVLLFYRGDW